ncbi:MAG: bifunctional aldolase/short-chain dehydrogenase [Alphaproteobacteria bacterium]|nr:bifunctional aldolase/short-chain dehydrogenase [Alphaproteobacteria bacterium]
MKSLWSDKDAQAFAARYADQGVSADLALRIYSSRLLGAEPRLVQHGGGNTSLKTQARDVFSRPVDVICVKGSGWDLDAIEPAGMPAMRLEHLLALRGLERLSDEQMVNEQRAALLDQAAPNPSVETLLHAWVPQKVIDHTHANAILALCDQPNGEAMCRDVFGDDIAYVPYVMPGFALAHAAADAYAAHRNAAGMILLKHGVFSWAATAQESYERMIALVTRAEDRIARAPKSYPVALPAPDARTIADLAPKLRGALMRATEKHSRVALAFRTNAAILAFINAEEAQRYANAGVVTPDHVIRTKPWPMFATEDLDRNVTDFVTRYRAYFERGNAASKQPKKPLDPTPRVVFAPGLGLFGVGATLKDANIAADIAETAIAVIADAERVGRFESIAEQDIFDMEHWSLEQAKLGKAQAKPLQGAIVAITGGAGAIGAATAQAFARAGADVAVLDIDAGGTEAVAKACKGRAFACDVTDAASVTTAFDEIARAFGGLDILVSNAGAAWTGKIGEVDEATLRASFELNFYGHQRAAQAAVRIMRAQAAGGCLLFNASKQALNPGQDFGPYGLAKAATLFLSRQYALDYGADGIRSNALNADRIRSGLLTDAMIAERSTARGLSEADYMGGNLLGREVAAADVADAFVALALSEKTTGALFTVDGGNIAAAPR